MNVKHELDRAGPIVDRVNAAIRENPLAAGLIGAGVAWMLMGGAKGFGALTGAAGSAGSFVATAGSALASGAAKAGSAGATGLTRAASNAADSVASLVPDISLPDGNEAFEAVTEAGAAAGSRINSAAAAGREYGAVLQSRLSASLDSQPLLLGAIGVAIGAGLASTFATTSLESELMGEQGTAARKKLQVMSDTVKDRAQQVASAVKIEAANQGLTPDAAQTVATEIGNKVKAVAGVGREAVAQSLASKPAENK